MDDLNANSIDQAKEMIRGTAKSMGIEIKDQIVAKLKPKSFNDIYDSDSIYNLEQAIDIVKKASSAKISVDSFRNE